MDPNTDHLFPSSTNSSPSSSDLDTESTGSFFPDRSTTLGTLMGLTSAAIPAGRRTEVPPSIAGYNLAVDQKPKVRRQIGTGWWRLCRGDMGPTTLEEFLRTERRTGATEGDFLYAVNGAGKLFEDGRVLPPPAAQPAIIPARRRRREGFPVMIAGICGGGEE